MPKSQRTPTNISIIEIDKNDSKPLGTEKELRASIIGLANNPGFEELLRRMRVQKAILEARLRNPSEDDNRHQLRALIDAYSFVERQLRTETGRPIEQPRGAYEDEKLEFERLAKYVEVIGRDAN